MKQKRTSHRRAIGLLLAAAALPLTPAIAQDTVPAPPQPPAVDTTPAPAPEAPPPVLVAPPAPTIAAPAPAPTIAPAPEAAQPAEPTATRSRATAPRRAPAPAPAATRTVTRTPAPVAAPPAPAPSTAPLAATPPGAEAPATAPAPAPADTAAAAPAPVANQPAQPARAIWPWLLGALILAGAAALLLMRRRRRDEVYYEETVEEPEVVAAPVMAPPLAETPVVAPAVAAAETGRPAIALRMMPKRAGVAEDDAVVEFELTVDNRGNAPARDVRVSTWMFPAGQSSEAEQLLIQQSGREADLPAITIDSGAAKKIEQTVTLPTSRVDEDAVLPVVVAEASYRLPDGTEERTSASFEVGVQVDDDLAYFDLENPSGLHDDVVARPHRETVDA